MIERNNASVNRPDSAIRVGSASWSDLSRLSEERLEEMDNDLDSYRMWLLNAIPKGGIGWHNALAELAQAAGNRMRDLLANYGVDYEDLSDSIVQSWKEPWDLFKDRDAPPQARLRALIENRWYWTRQIEGLYTCITAVRTFEELMIWRGRWTKNAQ